MIQRIQSIWLLLAAVLVALTFKLPFYSGNINTAATDMYKELRATHNVILIIVTTIAVMLPIAAILLYKDRGKQILLSILGIAATIAAIALLQINVKSFTTGNYSLTAVLNFIAIVFYFLAIKGIRKDQKLIKSMSKLR